MCFIFTSVSIYNISSDMLVLSVVFSTVWLSVMLIFSFDLRDEDTRGESFDNSCYSLKLYSL